MTMPTKVFEGIGKELRLDHVTIEVPYDCFEKATALLRNLGFNWRLTEDFSDDWQEGRNFYPPDGNGETAVQLIGIRSVQAIAIMHSLGDTQCYLALAVDDPSMVAEKIRRWVSRLRRRDDLLHDPEEISPLDEEQYHAIHIGEQANGSIWVSLPDLLGAVALKLVYFISPQSLEEIRQG
jgi:hypothetical protein